MARLGRPRQKKVSKWGYWKRAQRDRPTGKGRGFVHHHPDGVMNNPNKMQVMSRSQHAKVDNPMKRAVRSLIKKSSQ